MKTSKLEKLSLLLNPNKEQDFCISIGAYWTIEVSGKLIKCTLDWDKNSCLNEKCKLEKETPFKNSDTKYLYFVLNGYLKGKYQTITSEVNQ